MIAELSPDVVLLDIKMPGLTGLELLDVYTDSDRLFALSLAGPNGS